MWIDGHWHSRGWKQSERETVQHSLDLAYASGGLAILGMPNTDPVLDTPELCQSYAALGKGHKVRFYTHGGLTPDQDQIKRMVEAEREFEEICGIKIFWGHSTGNLGIIERDIQYEVMRCLASEGCTAVIPSHCEKESLMDTRLYDPSKPKTWSTLCRPEAAEIESFRDILAMAEDVGFKGTLHVAHVSTCEVVDMIHNYEGPVKLSCGVTPHHIFLDNSMLDRPDGNWYKCNPPLRSPETQQGLLERVLDGRIPIIESDHAPHTARDKARDVPFSGIISGPVWPYVVQELRRLGMSADSLHAAVQGNVRALYNLDIDPEIREVDWAKVEEERQSYPHNPFEEFFTL